MNRCAIGAIIVLLFCYFVGCASIQYKMIKRNQPESCKEALNQIESLERLKWKDFDNYTNIEATIYDKLGYILSRDPNCIDARILYGDRLVRSGFYRDSLLTKAIRVYKQGLESDSSNTELLSRLAFVYDLTDSLEYADYYYGRAGTKPNKFADIDSLYYKFKNADSLVGYFFKYPDESYILLEKIPTYYFDEPPKIYCKIFPDGRIEYNDYFGDFDNPVNFWSSTSIDTLRDCLKSLEDIRFFSMHNPFIRKACPVNSDFEYVFQWHLPNYKVVYHTPLLEHSMSVYGLLKIYGDNIMRYTLSITYVKDLNIPRESYVMNKIDTLSVFWHRLFTSDYIIREMKNRFGEYEFPIYGYENYIYFMEKDCFIKFQPPTFQIIWSTPKNSQIKPPPGKILADNMVFSIDDSLFALRKESGDISYVHFHDESKYPFLSIDYEHIYEGRIVDSNAMLLIFSRSDGKHLYTIESNSKGTTFSVKYGKKINSYSRDRILRKIDEMHVYYKQNGLTN